MPYCSDCFVISINAWFSVFKASSTVTRLLSVFFHWSFFFFSFDAIEPTDVSFSGPSTFSRSSLIFFETYFEFLGDLVLPRFFFGDFSGFLLSFGFASFLVGFAWPMGLKIVFDFIQAFIAMLTTEPAMLSSMSLRLSNMLYCVKIRFIFEISLRSGLSHFLIASLNFWTAIE